MALLASSRNPKFCAAHPTNGPKPAARTESEKPELTAGSLGPEGSGAAGNRRTQVQARMSF